MSKMLHNCHDVKYKSNYLMLYGFLLLLVMKLLGSGIIVGSTAASVVMTAMAAAVRVAALVAACVFNLGVFGRIVVVVF